MRSRARLAVERAPAPRGSATVVRRQRSHGALVLRPTLPAPPDWARAWGFARSNTAAVHLVAGAAGPVGGDDWRFDVDVGDNAALLLSAVAGTVILPGPHGEPSRSEVNIRVGAGGTLMWEPGVQIAATGCRHETVNRVHLEAGARLFVREEAVLGRHGERPGNFSQRLRVTRDGRPLYDQTLSVGPDAPGWNGPSVMGGRRALGSLLVVDPGPGGLADTQGGVAEGLDDTAIMSLDEGATLITALKRDAISLRAHLNAAFQSSLVEGSRRTNPSAKPKSYTVKKAARR